MAPRTSAQRIETDSRRVEKVYDVLARVYDGAFDWALGPGRRRAIAALPIERGDRVLEVGVGTGLSFPIYPSGTRVTGIDISESMLNQAEERAETLDGLEIDLHRMDARSLEFPDGTFDHVLAPYVISVVPEPERVMAEIVRVCKPGGTIHVVNHFESPIAPVRWFERIFTPLTQWIGFRMDLPTEIVSSTEGLVVDGVEQVNLLGHWTLLKMRRNPKA